MATLKELAQSYHIGDTVAYEGLTYDVKRVTKSYITIGNDLATVFITRKGDFAKLTMMQESMERYQ